MLSAEVVLRARFKRLLFVSSLLSIGLARPTTDESR